MGCFLSNCLSSFIVNFMSSQQCVRQNLPSACYLWHRSRTRLMWMTRGAATFRRYFLSTLGASCLPVPPPKTCGWGSLQIAAMGTSPTCSTESLNWRQKREGGHFV